MLVQKCAKGEIVLYDESDKRKCPACGVKAVVLLTPRQLAEQKDGTVAVCHPGLDGCNQGYALT